ncbi:hypothetical protein [Petroclostridium sp. X23]|uniref:hypothetical protein n=1 Tax=Petroclostridium sp. X23 TaxID=3045146 RepID=UPI0024AE289D|nr:hypothetical protein [Petroclostridium sp. X23]WHH60634.1 hypothetical protein QKW49_07995 [Petroclostridium sp. X23]
MMSKNSGQIDIFNSIIFEKLIPKDHLLIKIDSIIDFPFVYGKDHIIIDEDSEIILSSVQTPFNVGDEKKLTELIEKVEEDFASKA